MKTDKLSKRFQFLNDDDLKDIIPSDMVVPKMRLELSMQNLSWLCRNLKINNGDHPEIKNTMKQIINIRKVLEREVEEKFVIEAEPPNYPLSMGDLHIWLKSSIDR